MPTPQARPAPGMMPSLGQMSEMLGEQMQSTTSTPSSASSVPTPAVQQGLPTPGGADTQTQESDPSVFDLAITRPVTAVVETVLAPFPWLQEALALKPEDPPEEQMRKKQLHQRMSQFTQEQQAYAQQLLQERQQRREMERQEEEQKRQLEQQKKQQSFVVPTSPQKGALDPEARLKQNRTTLSTPQGAD